MTNTKKILILVGLVVLALIAGGLIYLKTRKNDQPPENKNIASDTSPAKEIHLDPNQTQELIKNMSVSATSSLPNDQQSSIYQKSSTKTKNPSLSESDIEKLKQSMTAR